MDKLPLAAGFGLAGFTKKLVPVLTGSICDVQHHLVAIFPQRCTGSLQVYLSYKGAQRRSSYAEEDRERKKRSAILGQRRTIIFHARGKATHYLAGRD